MGAKPRVYSSSVRDFRSRLLKNVLFEELEANYPSVVGHSVPPAEARSWRESLPRLEHILRLSGIADDAWVTIEERIPYYSKRIDVTLSGRDSAGRGVVLLIELKAWRDISRYDETQFQTVIGGRPAILLHPSLQVRAYHEHLEDFYVAFHGRSSLALRSCAYCHNYSERGDDSLFGPDFQDLLESTPTFGQAEAEEFATFIQGAIASGDGQKVIAELDARGIGPSKQLIRYASDIIAGQRVFTLLDEQLAANKAILGAVAAASKRGSKSIVLVRGGPGTGKSVIALNALGESLKRKLIVYLVTGSSAFTHGIRKLLGERLKGLVRFTDFFWDHEPESVDVLIVDEAHRMRAKSEPRVPAADRPTISQAEELINAGKVVVFFMDENQIISPDEVGEPDLIREIAKRRGIPLLEFKLESQFRCSGSDVYLRWLDNLFGLDDDPEVTHLVVPEGFDLRLVDGPQELLDEVRSNNRSVEDSARLLAGWCWPWTDPLPNGLVDDIVIDEFRFPWESKNGKRPPPGIPEAKYWAVDPAGVNQAGTVYSVQGYEMSHVGVILGPDLVVRNGKWQAVPRANFSRKLSGKVPEAVLPYIKRIYRTLLSRPMQSCSIYCTDLETMRFIESRMSKSGQELK